MLSWLRDRISNARSRGAPVISLTDNGFQCQTPERDHIVHWSAIMSIDAFKRDELTTDLICLEIASRDGCLLLHEGMEGFGHFREAMENELGISSDWFGEVMLPPFATNLQRIFPAAAA